MGQKVHGDLRKLLKEHLIAVYFSSITDHLELPLCKDLFLLGSSHGFLGMSEKRKPGIIGK